MTIWTVLVSARVARRHQMCWTADDGGTEIEEWEVLTPWFPWKKMSSESPGEAREDLRFLTNDIYINEKLARGKAQVEVFRGEALVVTLTKPVPYRWGGSVPELEAALVT